MGRFDARVPGLRGARIPAIGLPLTLMILISKPAYGTASFTLSLWPVRRLKA
jgi:hypothetical protein